MPGTEPGGAFSTELNWLSEAYAILDKIFETIFSYPVSKDMFPK